jgi:hypothetical protein
LGGRSLGRNGQAPIVLAAFATFAFATFSKGHRFFFWFCSHGFVFGLVVVVEMSSPRLSFY